MVGERSQEVKNRSQCAKFMAGFAISFKLEVPRIRWTRPESVPDYKLSLRKNVICVRGLVTEGRRIRVCSGLFNLDRSCGSLLVALGEADFKDSVLVGGFGCSRVNQVWQFELFEVSSLGRFHSYFQGPVS